MSPTELVNHNEPLFQILGSVSPKVGSMSDQELRDLVSQLESSGEGALSDLNPELVEALIRSYVNIAAHLIHRPGFSDRGMLDRSVARPLMQLSRLVGRPPSLTYASYVLANFVGPVPSKNTMPHDLSIAQTPSCTSDEDWFVAVHLSIESAGGQIVTAIEEIETALEEDTPERILDAIQVVESCLSFAIEVLPAIYERLAPVTFREEIRPLLYGHDQIVFEGVGDGELVTYVGETGAQSGIIRAIDAILGVSHSDPMKDSMTAFAECAPPLHRSYFQKVDPIGKSIASKKLPRKISEARQSALKALGEFRRTHLRIVSGYLMPEGKQLSNRGTGGTEFRHWLQNLIDDAESSG